MATAVSGTVGVGNIGGVAVAITVGGPGAAFWLFIAGLLSMSTKLVECTLGVKYRRYNADGSVSGGPMFYMEAYFRERGWPTLGKGFGGFYAAALVVGCLGIGNMFQSNQAFAQVLVITGGAESIFADRGWVFGLLLAGVIAAVIIGGIQSIARVAAVLVPVMALLYLISALAVIGLSAEHIPAALSLVVSEAFTGQAASGGLLGAMVIGFQRALFSNEAGIGSASIAHSAVKTEAPASEGITALLEPFIDTVVICSLSSLVILTTAIPQGLMGSGLAGIELTSAAFAWHFAWAPYVIAVAALLFAFSSALAWSYYGLKGWTYLFGEGRHTGHRLSDDFLRVYCPRVHAGTPRRARLLRCDDLHDRATQHSDAVPLCAYGQARGESIHRRHALCSVGLIALADDAMQPACGREEIIDGFVLCAAVIPQHQTVRCPTEAAGELRQTGMPPEELQHFRRL